MCRGCLGLSLAPPLASLASWRTDPAKHQDKDKPCLCWAGKSLATLLQGHSSFLSTHNECISFPTPSFNEGAQTRAQWQPYTAKEVSGILSIMHVTIGQRWMCYCRLALCEKYNDLIGSYHSSTEEHATGMADALNPKHPPMLAASTTKDFKLETSNKSTYLKY